MASPCENFRMRKISDGEYSLFLECLNRPREKKIGIHHTIFACKTMDRQLFCMQKKLHSPRKFCQTRIFAQNFYFRMANCKLGFNEIKFHVDIVFFK